MDDFTFMRRALQLSKNGEGRVSPNPMVGAVIAARGRIIGEGYHRHWGGPHAEVNAIASVSTADRPLLAEATMYVTLEPCSHYGKTPPCAKLIIDTGIPHVVVATLDPYVEVAGRGVKMLRDAGIKVDVGLLGDEARDINRRFMTAHTLRRPYIQLKWAESADGFIATPPGTPRAILSTPLSMVRMHRERALADAIMVGTNTVLADNPRLDCRLWPGRTPAAVTFESPRLLARLHDNDNSAATGCNTSTLHIADGRRLLLRHPAESITDFVNRLYSDEKIISLMVEGGTRTLTEFIDNNLFDEIRIEHSPQLLGNGIKSPALMTEKRYADQFNIKMTQYLNCDGNLIWIYRQ